MLIEHEALANDLTQTNISNIGLQNSKDKKHEKHTLIGEVIATKSKKERNMYTFLCCGS